jgi:hypothetical protein
LIFSTQETFSPSGVSQTGNSTSASAMILTRKIYAAEIALSRRSSQ